MRKLTWVGLAAFVAGIGCGVAGVLLSPRQVPGRRGRTSAPSFSGLFLAAAVLVIVGGRFGLYPLLQWGVRTGKIPLWVLGLFLIVGLGAAVAYLVLHPEP